MTDIDPQILAQIARAVVTGLGPKSDQITVMVNQGEFRGSTRYVLRENERTAILKPFGMDNRDVQIEVIQVQTNLARIRGDRAMEIHFHERSHTHVIALGNEQSCRTWRGLTYDPHTREWKPFEPGDELAIPPGEHHGFSVDAWQSGELWFVSVQAPPIVDEQGHDDYHHVTSI